MGLGLSLNATLRRGTADNPTVVRHFAEVFFAIASSQPVIGRLSRACEGSDSAIGIEVMPLEEEVSFSCQSDRLTVSAKTSTLGPGYHAYLCMLLDKFADETGLSWTETEDEIDETGYFSTRDFPALQLEMARWLKAISERLVEIGKDPDFSMMRIGFPVRFAPVGLGSFALTHRGPRNREFFKKISNSGDRGLMRMAESHFPWWTEGLDEQSAHALVEALLWMEYPWRSELDEREQKIADAILALAEISGNLQNIDQLDIEELDSLLNSNVSIGPNRSGIGYMRGSMERPLAGPWTINLPGFFHETFDPDDNTLTYWFGDKTVHATTFAIDRSADFKAEDVEPNDQPDIAFVDNGTAYYAETDRGRESGRDYYSLVGTVEAEFGAAVISVLYDDPNDKDWAVSVFKSVKPRQD